MGFGECGGVGGVEPGGEVTDVELPFHVALVIGEGGVVGWGCEELVEAGFVIGEVGEGGFVLQGEGEGFGGLVEAKDLGLAGQVIGGCEDGEGVAGCAEADIPDDEGFLGGAHAFAQPGLAHVERIGFFGGSDYRVEGFGVAIGSHAIGSIGELDQAVFSTCHGRRS